MHIEKLTPIFSLEVGEVFRLQESFRCCFILLDKSPAAYKDSYLIGYKKRTGDMRRFPIHSTAYVDPIVLNVKRPLPYVTFTYD